MPSASPFQRIVDCDLLAQAAGKLRAGTAVRLAGVWGAAPTLLAAAAGRKTRRPVLLVCPHLDDADAAADDIEILTGSAAHIFPAWEAQLATDRVSEEVTGERLRVLNALSDSAGADETVEFLVAPMLSLLQPVPTADALSAGRLALRRGMDIGPAGLIDWLVEAGFEHVEQVDQAGEFAHRGGIVDIFPPGLRRAIRCEFWGDELDSLRAVDLDSQRSVEELSGADVTAMNVGRSLDAGSAQTTHLLDYLPADAILFLPEPNELRDLADQLYDRIRDDLADEASPVALREVDEVFATVDRFARAETVLFAGQSPGVEQVRMGIRSLERLNINTAEALAELEELSEAVDVWVYCDTSAERDRFSETLAERHPTLASRAHLAVGHISAGFHWPEAQLAIVGHHEVYHRYSKVRRIRRVRTGRPIQSLLDLADGDYVVHVAHGIAKFDGLHRMQREGSEEEYLRLRFADNAVLNVPASQINLVQKYIGSKGKRPTLSKLGGGHWARAKERVSEAVQDLAAEMLRLQAMRDAMPGHSYPRATDLQRQFADEFLYSETEDQLSAILQIDDDMARQRPMDRLICGDVGYGKTEIAMRAAMKTVEAGRQVGVLVPTTVLADQHFRTFTERFADFPVRIEVISRFRTAKETADIVKRLVLGQIDVLIGTHRLLSKDVRFADLGLIVIDEEQRFGVAAKEHLKSLRATVDVLTLTATPIPRTLHMSLLGLRDISSLQTPPMDRRSIHTEVVQKDDELIRAALLRELNRGGQVFFVHNRVQDIDSVATHVRSLVPDARIAIGHGQMAERGLEKVMLAFARGDVDVLVCTTIIESGLDIPTANTMIIHEADRFGLAELHQLRGRVGRYKHRAYCYLLLPETRTVSPVAGKRLKAIEDFSDLGAGFQIAMRDLEIRGAGNILGPQQSGHIATVGYEMYCQLLDSAVRTLKGESRAPTLDVHIELGIDAYIPRAYIPAERQRMEVYRRLVLCPSVEELDRLRADLVDAYGPVPEEVDQLLDVGELRVLAGQAGIGSMILMRPDVIFRVKEHRSAETVFGELETPSTGGRGGSVRLPDANTVHWRPTPNTLDMPTLLNTLLLRFRTALTPGRVEALRRAGAPQVQRRRAPEAVSAEPMRRTAAADPPDEKDDRPRRPSKLRARPPSRNELPADAPDPSRKRSRRRRMR